MGDLVIRNLDDATAARLSRQAAEHGRSVEDEVRAIVAEVVRVREAENSALRTGPATGLGSTIHRLFAPLGGLDIEVPQRGEMHLPDFE